MKALKEFAVNGLLFTVGDEVPESLVTTAMIESGKVQGENREEGLLIEEPSEEVEVSTKSEPEQSEEPEEPESQEYPAEVETKDKPKGRSRKS